MLKGSEVGPQFQRNILTGRVQSVFTLVTVQYSFQTDDDVWKQHESFTREKECWEILLILHSRHIRAHYYLIGSKKDFNLQNLIIDLIWSTSASSSLQNNNVYVICASLRILNESFTQYTMVHMGPYGSCSKNCWALVT